MPSDPQSLNCPKYDGLDVHSKLSFLPSFQKVPAFVLRSMATARAFSIFWMRTCGRSCTHYDDRPDEYAAVCDEVEAGDKESYPSSAVI